LEPHTPRSCVVDDGKLVYVIYTSGSTGEPKGSNVLHTGFTALIDWYCTQFTFTSSDRFLIVSSISFDLTQKNLFGALSVGAQLILWAPVIFDPRDVLNEIVRLGITVINCTP